MKPAIAAIAAVISHTLIAGTQTQQMVYRVHTDAVVIDVSVTNRGTPVTGLTKDDFEVRDNGVLQRVLDFSRETRPIDLTLTIDISGSMKESDRRIVERAVERVSGALAPDDRASVVTFGSHIAAQTPPRHPPITLDISDTGNGSAVLDALLLSLVTSPSPDRQQFHIFMTDGQDNSSYFDSHTVVETAKHSNAPTSIVLVPNRANDRFLGVLKAVTSVTGGEMFELEGRDELGQAFLTALENFRTSYMLRYMPSGVEAAGWHDVSVAVTSGAGQVRARRGYWGSERDQPGR